MDSIKKRTGCKNPKIKIIFRKKEKAISRKIEA
jgi:hypothetical protein